MARGVWYVEGGGEGDAPGEENSVEGLVTRIGPRTAAPKFGRGVSSSEVAVSTSLSKEDRNEGSALVSIVGRIGLPARLLVEPARDVIVGDAAEELAVSSTRLVRGRFSFRSGSLDSAGSDGEAVADFAFLFRPRGLTVSNSFALSRALHAWASSAVSTGDLGGCSRKIGATFRNSSRAVCPPKRPIISKRRCQFALSRRSSCDRR